MGILWITYIVRTRPLHNEIFLIFRITEHESKPRAKSEAHGCYECFTAKSKYTFLYSKSSQSLN